MRRCLRKDKFRATKVELAQAWHAYSISTNESLRAAANKNAQDDAALAEDSLAWITLPASDIELLQILTSRLGCKAKATYYAVYFVCNLVAGLILAWVSQFLIFDEAIKRVSSQLTSPLIGANFYPAADDVGKKTNISVFAIDDDDLKFFKKTYPLPYAFHAQMLDAFGTLSPKAVFIDIWFHDKRDDPSIGELVDAICRLHQGGTRVYLATLSPDGSDTPTLRPELQAITVPATGPRSLENKPQACAVEVAVDKAVDAIDRQSWRYDLVSGVANQQIFSAAAQIYNDLPGSTPLTLSASPLALIWGVKGAEINRRPPGYGPTENTGCRNNWFTVEAIPMPAALRHTLFASEPDLQKPFCAYHATLPLSALRNMPGEALQPLIEDRLIVYGGNLQSMDDAQYSPVHGRLAGLHMHAMALDNLLHYGDQYPAAEEFDLEKPYSAGTLFPVAVVSVFALFATLFRWAYSSLSGNPRCIPLCLQRLLEKARRLQCACHIPFARWFKKTVSANQEKRLLSTALRLVTAWYAELKKACIYLGLPNLVGWIVSWCRRIVLTIAMVFLMAWIGLHYFHLGPLSWMEYAVYPITIEFLHIGKRLADYVHPKLIDLSRLIKRSWHKTFA
ncbi:CHASE2 domain-containing protein [Herminiimonas sp. NPDC097707]|uniref:CHASE2 domain-containing protein n=1 Tax=Herminiimonas sp. NPDC097707 TaxID=3364007 RepID=UPI00383B052B